MNKPIVKPIRVKEIKTTITKRRLTQKCIGCGLHLLKVVELEIIYCKNNCLKDLSLIKLESLNKNVKIPLMLKERMKEFFDIYDQNKDNFQAKMNDIVLAQAIKMLELLSYFNMVITSDDPLYRFINVRSINVKLTEIIIDLSKTIED